MTHGASEALRAVIEPLVTDAGFDLEELSVTPTGRRRLVRIIIDGDAGVDLDAAADLSTAVSACLDAGPADDVFGDAAYTLEVTSPGIGRPLTLPRHFRRATGRLLHITAIDGSSSTGRVRRLDGDTLVLLGGPTGLQESTIELQEIRKAVVEVEFSPVPAAVAAVLAGDAADPADGVAPATADDAEEDEEDAR
jgi:ribosome maturation factor RimP